MRRGNSPPVTIDEQGNVIVQLFNILLEAVSKDVSKFKQDVQEAYNKLISTLAGYVDFECLHPVKRYLLEQNLMSDVILSHLEYLDVTEDASEPKNSNWLKLSGRTKALIAIAVTECGRTSLDVTAKKVGAGLRVESV